MKKRFAIKTVSIGARGSINGKAVRSHDTLKEAFRYAEGRIAQAKADGANVEFGIMLRPMTAGSNNLPNLSQTTVTAKQAASRWNGKPRYPFAVVKVDKSGNPAGVVGRSSTFAKARDRAARAISYGNYSNTEYAVVIRTATRGGELPKFAAV